MCLHWKCWSVKLYSAYIQHGTNMTVTGWRMSNIIELIMSQWMMVTLAEIVET
jgi:hypothetical protein